MKKYKQVEKVYKDKECIQVVCDLCGRERKRQRYHDNDWETGSFDRYLTTIMAENSQCYPGDGPYGERYSVDICPECFEGKLIPWLKEQGVTTEWEDFG